MTRDELLLRTRMATGQAYKILTETMGRYWNKKSLLYWIRLSSELDAKKTDAYKADSLFPYEFFDAMADPLLRWHWDRYDGIRDAEITPTFQMLWQYHRKYLGQVQTDEMWTEAIKDGDEILKDADPHLKGFVMAILRDLEKRNPREEDNSANEQAAEKSASQTV